MPKSPKKMRQPPKSRGYHKDLPSDLTDRKRIELAQSVCAGMESDIAQILLCMAALRF